MKTKSYLQVTKLDGTGKQSVSCLRSAKRDLENTDGIGLIVHHTVIARDYSLVCDVGIAEIYDYEKAPPIVSIWQHNHIRTNLKSLSKNISFMD